MLLGLGSAASAATYDSTVSSGSITGDPNVVIGAAESPISIGIQPSDNGTITINTSSGGTIDVYAATYGINFSGSSGTVTVGSENTSTLTFTTTYDKDTTSPDETNANYLAGVRFAGSNNKLKLDAKKIVISANAGSSDKAARGLAIGSGDSSVVTATIGSENTQELIITSSGSDSSIGVSSLKAHTTLTAKNIHISTNGYYGVLAQNSTQDENPPDDRAKLIINGENTEITAGGAALMAFSNGYLEVNGNLTATAPNAIDTRGHANVVVNKKKDSTVQLNGNIAFETPGPAENSGDVIDSTVEIYLTNANSYWKGNVYLEYPKKDDNTAADPTTSADGLNIYLANGAQWYATKVNVEASSDHEVKPESFVNNLELNGGVINTAEGLDKIRVDELQGTGGQINLAASTADGSTITATKINIDKVTAIETPNLTVTARSISADDITDADTAMASLNNLVLVSGSVTKTNVIQEGDVVGAISQTVDANGTTSEVKVVENTKLLSFKSLNAASVATWRNEVAYTNQRLDFLRDNAHAFGVWAQVYGGNSKFDEAELELDTVTAQVGFDANLGGWVTGAAFSYTDGDADYSNGSADVESYTVALYTERRFDNGFFVNGMARYGRLSTDAEAGNMVASYDNNAFSIGGNVGYRLSFADDRAFFEPTIGLQYAYVQGDDFTSSNNVTVEQDDYDAFIGDIGARLGLNFAEGRGNAYVRVHVSHDFGGDLDGVAYNDKARANMEADIGGTWVTYGVGTQVNCTDNFTIFANFDRSSGNEVDSDYLLNAGMRYTF